MNSEKFANILNARLEKGLRINKFIADTGFCSRREADTYLQAGKIKIKGRQALIGDKVFPGDIVEIDGVRYTVSEKNENHNAANVSKIVIAFNKPKGIICTTDKREKANIIDALPIKERIFPVGRLDLASTGLILLTNDGDLINRLLRSENAHEKEYELLLDRNISDEDIKKMEAGLFLAELERKTLPCRIKRLAPNKIRIILIQGLNRQIRRMCDCLNYKVLALKRVRIMNITLGKLKPGEYRYLSFKELQQLESLL